MTAQTVTGAVAKRETGPVSVMWDRKTHFAAILPVHIDVKSFLGTAAAALYRDDKLMAAAQASPDSLIQALMRCAALGHQPGTDEFYLTPRKVKGVPTVQGIEGYRGIVERMYRSGAVKSVIVREVCAKDTFKFVEGRDEKPYHVFGGGDASTMTTGAGFFGATGSRDRGPMVGVYAYAILTTGAVSRVVILSRDDVMAAREASDSKDSDYSPWNRLDGGKDHPEFTGRSMWWKTAARRLEPWVPTSAEYRREQLRAAAAAVEASGAPPSVPAASSGHAEVVDAEIVEEPQTEAPPAATTQATKPALDKLDRLERQVLAGWSHAEVDGAYLRITGDDWTASKLQVQRVTQLLEDALKARDGDKGAANAALRDQFGLHSLEASNG